MCLIIEKEPGFEIDYDKLKIACVVNPDGYGLSWVQDGRLMQIKSIEKNDHVKIKALLQKHKEKKLWLHLRHATVGSVNAENCHPFFPVVEPGLDIGFMHNGTLQDFNYKDSKLSDSANFAVMVVKPMYLRSLALLGPEKTLNDFFAQKVLKAYAWSHSIFVLFDNFGNSIKINGDKGEQHEGWWSSNKDTYSTSHHRYPSTIRGGSSQNVYPFGQSKNQNQGRTTSTSSVTYYNNDTRGEDTRSNGVPWAEWGVPVTNKFSQSTWENDLPKDTAPTNSFWSSWRDYKRLKFELDQATAAIMCSTGKESIMSELKNLTSKRESFVEKTGLTDIKDVLQLTRGDFVNLCDNFPMAMSELFIDLCLELKLHETEKEKAA